MLETNFSSNWRRRVAKKMSLLSAQVGRLTIATGLFTPTSTGLKKKRKLTHELAFDGHWDLSEKNRLVYFLGGSSESAFRFRGAFQTKSVFAKKGELRYQLGCEINGKRQFHELIFFGKWKVSRDLGLSFEMEAGRDKKRFLNFGAEYSFNGGKQIAATLKSYAGESLGLEVIFTNEVFGRDGQTFLRLQKSIEESRIEGGVSVRF